MKAEEEIAPDQEVDFCTMGMLIIDEIHFLPPQPPVYDILGGAGTFSALGARLFSPPPLSKRVGWVVDKGSDFPASVSTLISSWQTSALIRHDASRLTTRGWNGYDSTEIRGFKYTTPKLRLTSSSLTSCRPLLRSKSFHLICSPTRCIDLVQSITSARSRLPNPPRRPLFIWEPVPDLCISDELLNTTRALGYVDVCSPNHAELGALMSYHDSSNGEIDRAFVQEAAEQLLESVPGSSIALVIRSGSAGCYIAQNGGRTAKRKVYSSPNTKKAKPKKIRGGGMTLSATTDLMALFAHLDQDRSDDDDDEVELDQPDWGISAWIPAYHQSSEAVVDPTGGGNTFLGAFAVALARGKGMEEAARWGNVAASLAIEQVGMPVLGTDDTGRETWNGVVVEERLEEFEVRWGFGTLGL